MTNNYPKHKSYNYKSDYDDMDSNYEVTYTYDKYI